MGAVDEHRKGGNILGQADRHHICLKDHGIFKQDFLQQTWRPRMKAGKYYTIDIPVSGYFQIDH